MGYKVLLDANVLMDFALPERAENEAARLMLDAVVARKTAACTTPAIIHMVSYFLLKEKPVVWVKNIWISLLDYVEVIELNHTFALQAIHSPMADIEDALQYFAGIQHRCTHFISSDKAFKKAATTQLPVLSAKQFLHLLK